MLKTTTLEKDKRRGASLCHKPTFPLLYTLADYNDIQFFNRKQLGRLRFVLYTSSNHMYCQVKLLLNSELSALPYSHITTV